jgi:hypothetical protein
MIRPGLVPVSVLLVTALLVSGCGDESGEPPPANPAATAAAGPVGSGEGDDADTPAGEESDGGIPDEQVLCGAVDEAPIEAALGEPVTNRAFHPPSGTGTNISCNWETITAGIGVKFVIWPDFRMLVDDDILDEYGQGEFDGVGVEAYRNVYRGAILAGPNGWAIDLTFVGTVNPTDEQVAAIGRTALAAAEQVA